MHIATKTRMALLAVLGGLSVATSVGASTDDLPWIPPSGTDANWLDNTAGFGPAIAGVTTNAGVNESFVMTVAPADPPVSSFAGPGLYSPVNAGAGTINANGTPWVRTTFIDVTNQNGSLPRFQLFINGPAAWDNGQQIVLVAGAVQQNNTNSATGGWADEAGTLLPAGNQVGPYNDPGGTGFANDSGTTRNNTSFLSETTYGGWGSNNKQVIGFATVGGGGEMADANQSDWGIAPAIRAQRVNGNTVTLQIGKLVDGTIEFYVNNGGTEYKWASTAFVDTGQGAFDFRQVEVGVVGFAYTNNNSGGSVTFTDFDWGDNYVSIIPEPASMSVLGLGGVLLMGRRRKGA
ncbi:MAG: PEP-CTERM sorting domain-containing protein [Planctomycetes bacterium]|nr:PEP-CTERM sorting domain-containing protein [Planctomycetota bacterium]